MTVSLLLTGTPGIIARGMPFFSSYDYSVRFMLLELSGCMGGEEDDFFELVKKRENAKMQVLKNYSLCIDFMSRTLI